MNTIHTKILGAFFLLVMSSASLAQSKKTQEAEINALKAEIAQLKKEKEIELNDEQKKVSYAFGILLGTNIKMQGADSLNVDVLSAAIKDVMFDRTLKMDQQQALGIVQQYMQQANEKKNAKNVEEGKTFLEENKTKAGVVETASGLQYRVLTSGSGKSPEANDKVTVHYTGKLLNGIIFDSSVQRGAPATFGINGVIRGWTEALQLMKEGDKWELYIPHQLGYGDRHAPGGKIPPYSTLIFEVELIKVN